MKMEQLKLLLRKNKFENNNYYLNSLIYLYNK